MIGGPVTVLLVEDNLGDARLMREMLRTTSSSRPGGRLSDSMSVTKPCW